MKKDRPLRVFFFGDSICFGQGVSPDRTWVVRIARELQAHYSDQCELTVQNPSVNGNTTRMALERIAYDVQSHRPHILFIQFGMNDCNVWESDMGHPRVSQAAFAANLSEIVARGRIFGAKQVILGTNHPTTRITDMLPSTQYTYEYANTQYNGITRQVARQQGALLADSEAVFRQAVATETCSYADLVLSDQLHLSERGHDLNFNSRLPLLRKCVEAVIAEL